MKPFWLATIIMFVLITGMIGYHVGFQIGHAFAIQDEELRIEKKVMDMTAELRREIEELRRWR